MLLSLFMFLEEIFHVFAITKAKRTSGANSSTNCWIRYLFVPEVFTEDFFQITVIR